MCSLEVLQPSQYDEYDIFLHKHQAGLLYYSSKYKKFLEELLHCTSQYWLVLEEKEIIGVMPLMFKKGKFGTVINSLPFYGSHGGIISNTEVASELLSAKYNDIVQGSDVVASNMVTNPYSPFSMQSIMHNETDERIGQFTNIDYSKDISIELMNSFHFKVRNMVRKAIKNVDNIIIDNNAWQFLCQTHNENLNAIGGKPKSSDFFNLIPKYFSQGIDYNIYLAINKKSEIMSAVLLFYFNNVVEYFTPVIKQEYRDLQPLSALIYQAMIDASKKGFKFWNWGGTWKSQEGVYRFKSRWNTKDIIYQYLNQINDDCLYNYTANQLLQEYPDFFVLPFNKLNNAKI